MADNDVLTRNDDGDLSVRTVASTGDNYVNKNDVYTRDDDGKLAVRIVGNGGGGGSDVHNLGWYADLTALQTAHPTATDGDYAILGSTDTVWVWDSDTSAWVDTDRKGEVTPDMIIVKSSTMPSGSTVPAGAVYQYVGTTNATYTHGYIYENVSTPSYTGTVEFNPASISGTTAACSGDDFAALVAEWGSGNITDIIKGTLTYDLSGGLLVFVGLDDTDTQVCTFQLYTQDYEDAGFTFTGTLQDGDVITFTTTISESASYAWTRIDVQPAPEALPSQTGNSGKFLTTDGTTASWATVGGLPSQTGQSGKFLTTDGTNASWSDKPLTNTGTGFHGVATGSYSTATGVAAISYGYMAGASGSNTVAIGNIVHARGYRSIAIGDGSDATSDYSLAFGPESNTTAIGAVQIGKGTNSEAGTVCFGITTDGTNFTNYKMLGSDGSIPADRTSPITSISTATVTQALANNYIYNCTVDMTSIEITLPATPTANFCAQLNFTSGSTPTAFTSPVGMVWLGDDVSTTFVPVANKRYAIMVFFDGVSTRGIVQAA